jgi:hypothetical protein
VTAWTSSLGAIPASPSAQPESASAQKTLGTSGLSSQTEFDFFAPDSAISRMSKDTLALDSEKSLESWNQSVTKRRGEYSARLKSAHRTNASGSLSWPTISVNESKNSVGKSQEHRNSIPLGTMALMQDAANWATPCAQMDGSPTRPSKQGPTGDGRLEIQVAMPTYGQAAPANPSTDGSRQGLWLTPRANEPTGDSTFVSRNGDRGQHCSPSLTIQVEKTAQWATPRSGKTTDENPETWAARQAKGDVATMPLTAQVKCWGTPTARDHKSGRGNEEREYKELTPMVERTQSGKLNPRWVEMLQAVPLGWTSPDCPPSVIRNWPKFTSGWSAARTAPTNSGCLATACALPPENSPTEPSFPNSAETIDIL